MTLDSATGVLTWTPTEAQGPSTNVITVRVTDNGIPPLSDTKSFTVIVNEVNSAPVLAPISDKTVTEGSLLTFTATATDADIPANSLIFTLDSGAPAGAAINATNGVFAWTPPLGFSPATNTVTIRVTDDGSPPLSDAKTFKIVVASAPRITGITLSSATAVTITWQAIPEKTYRVQSTASLASGAWTTVGSDVLAAGVTGTITDDTSGTDRRFYRVMQLD
jgi:hypothetical protein